MRITRVLRSLLDRRARPTKSGVPEVGADSDPEPQEQDAALHKDISQHGDSDAVFTALVAKGYSPAEARKVADRITPR